MPAVIDGLATIYLKTVPHLFSLAAKRPLDEATLEKVRRLQWKVSAAQEFIVNHGILGIREGMYEELPFGHLSGGRLPLRGALAVGAFEEWNGILGYIVEEEKIL